MMPTKKIYLSLIGECKKVDMLVTDPRISLVISLLRVLPHEWSDCGSQSGAERFRYSKHFECRGELMRAVLHPKAN